MGYAGNTYTNMQHLYAEVAFSLTLLIFQNIIKQNLVQKLCNNMLQNTELCRMSNLVTCIIKLAFSERPEEQIFIILWKSTTKLKKIQRFYAKISKNYNFSFVEEMKLAISA